jgi:hypothetical protein
MAVRLGLFQALFAPARYAAGFRRKIQWSRATAEPFCCSSFLGSNCSKAVLLQPLIAARTVIAAA